MLTSDGRAYIVRWAPITPSTTRSKGKAKAKGAEAGAGQVLFDESLEDTVPASEDKWAWRGVCFHPASRDETDQERELDKGRGASQASINERMGLVAVGCEE